MFASVRLIVLNAVLVIATLLFVTMATCVIRQRPMPVPGSPRRSSALTECLWSLVPWLLMAACVIPSVRRVAAGG
jgi:heme/copper-type cytochrome/quinol oxidase subunit 2